MRHLILAAALAAGCTLASSSPALAAARSYDCSKPGNASKAVCKGGAKAAPAKATKSEAKAKPAKAAKVAAVKAAPKPAKATPAKAAPKAAPAAAAAKPTLMQRVGGMFGRNSAAKAPAARPAAASRRTASAAPASAEDRNPAGAIAQCKDGTYSHSKTRSGACSRHGGVAKWG